MAVCRSRLDTGRLAEACGNRASHRRYCGRVGNLWSHRDRPRMFGASEAGRLAYALRGVRAMAIRPAASAWRRREKPGLITYLLEARGVKKAPPLLSAKARTRDCGAPAGCRPAYTGLRWKGRVDGNLPRVGEQGVPMRQSSK